MIAWPDGNTVERMRAPVSHRMLIAAAVLAGAVGLALIALGWWVVDWQYAAGWDRLTDGEWWTGTAVRWIGYLTFSKFGLKAALAVVVGVMALAAWRRRRTTPIDEAESTQPHEQASDAQRASVG